MSIENNILIAEFLGWKEQKDPSRKFFTQFFNEYGERKGGTAKEPLLFHSSWDWLMEVIEKIDKTDTLSSTEEPYWYCVSLMGSYASVTDGKTGKIIIEISEENDYSWIGVAYKLAVDFVKWYKKNKNHDNGN